MQTASLISDIFPSAFLTIFEISSVTVLYLPSLKKPIAMGIVDIKYSKIGSDIVFESRGIKKNEITTWLLFGVFAALGILSKYLFINLLDAKDIF